MSFVSYAQNYEDVMLWRALKHIKHGFYIDIGACDPETHSVTKAFYERGWHGINVEPVSERFERFKKTRPRDINLQIALDAGSGEITLYERPDIVFSTAKKEFAELHVTDRGYQKQEQHVSVGTFSMVCDRVHASSIHFLKINVGRVQKTVLEGMDFGKIRPWIILVESTLPNTQKECHSEWEPLLMDADYEYVYFDGLNRYYVAREHEDLKAAFNAPPNVFDDFIRSEQLESELQAQQAGSRAAVAEARAQKADARINELQTELNAVHAANHHHWQLSELRDRQIQSIYRSCSWRITAPIRFFLDAAVAVKQRSFTPQSALRKAVASALNKPLLVALVHRCLRPFPRLHAYVTRLVTVFVYPPFYTAPMKNLSGDLSFANMTVNARKIYYELKSAIEKNRNYQK